MPSFCLYYSRAMLENIVTGFFGYKIFGSTQSNFYEGNYRNIKTMTMNWSTNCRQNERDMFKYNRNRMHICQFRTKSRTISMKKVESTKGNQAQKTNILTYMCRLYMTCLIMLLLIALIYSFDFSLVHTSHTFWKNVCLIIGKNQVFIFDY